jgi:hypothetical protein
MADISYKYENASGVERPQPTPINIVTPRPATPIGITGVRAGAGRTTPTNPPVVQPSVIGTGSVTPSGSGTGATRPTTPTINPPVAVGVGTGITLPPARPIVSNGISLSQPPTVVVGGSVAPNLPNVNTGSSVGIGTGAVTSNEIGSGVSGGALSGGGSSSEQLAPAVNTETKMPYKKNIVYIIGAAAVVFIVYKVIKRKK